MKLTMIPNFARKREQERLDALTAKVEELVATTDALIEYQGLTVREVAPGTYEVVKQTEHPAGDFTNPIQWVEGMPVTAGLFYWFDDYDLRKMALADGVPASWTDAALFEQI